LIAALVFLAGCAARNPAVVTPVTGTLFFAAHAQQVLPLSSGDPEHGRAAFIALQCHACHRVAEDETLPVVEGAWDGPVLRDFAKESPEAVGWRIVTRTRLGPESLFESPMVESATTMTERQLVDLIAYLRDPAAGQPK
jgi:mono/diheme cytochrome c family protein